MACFCNLPTGTFTCIVDFSTVFLAIALAQSAAPADDKVPPINPDRPDFTNGAGITPQGKVVVELGYRQTATKTFTLRQYGDQPVVRFALNPNLELRVGPGDYGTVRWFGGTDQGWEDSSLGAKWCFHNGKDKSGFGDPSLALEADVEIPSGGRFFRADRAIPSLTGIVDFSIADGWDLAGNLVFAWNKDDAGDFWQTSASLSLGHDLAERVGSFLETYMTMTARHGVPTDHFADAGLTYRLNNDCQLDASVGTQLDRHRQTGVFGFGVSVRF